MKKVSLFALSLALLLSACTPPAVEIPVSPASAPVESTVPTAPPAPSASPAPSAPLVYTDYSQLGPHEKPELPVAKFTRRYAEFTDTLIPANDYGPLIPFPGATVTRPAEDDWGGWMEDYSLYGLMTLAGEVVVDPVFSSAYAPTIWDEDRNQARELDCLILQKVVQDESGEPMSVAALCARDGSWCTGFDYSYDWELLMDRREENVIPMRRAGDGVQALVFLDVRTGEAVKTIDLGEVMEHWPSMAWSLIYNLRYGERYAIFSDDAAHYLFDGETGEVQVLEELLNTELEGPYATSFSEGLCPVKTASGWGYIDGNGNWITDPIYENAQPFENGHALVQDEQQGGWYTYIDHRGRVVYTLPDGEPFSDGGFSGYQNLGQRHYLDKNFRELPLPGDFTDPQVSGDWFIQDLPDPSPTVPGGTAFWNYKTGVRQDFDGEWEFISHTLSEDRVLSNGYADERRYALADLNTGELTELGHWGSAFLQRDGLTGEPYLYLLSQDGKQLEFRSLNGDTLYRTDTLLLGNCYLLGGKVFDAGKSAVTLTDLKTGELLFSWPLRALED